MKVYIVVNVRPDYQVFKTYEEAFEFAKKKANKRRGPTGVWSDYYSKDGINELVYSTSEIVIPESHIWIVEREF